MVYIINNMEYSMLGTFIFIFGNLFTFVSFAFGAQSLIASLESVQFVSNIFFAKYVHKETITRRMIYATLSIIVGNIMVVLFANHSAQKFSSSNMIYLYKTNYIYHGYLGIAFFIWLTCSCIYRKYHHSRMVLRTLLWEHSFIEPFCFAVSSAIIGTQAVLNSKCLALLIDSTSTPGNKNEFTFWYIYFILGTWLLLVVYWLRRLDLGLSMFPPLFIIPVMQVFFVFFAILCGGIYFEEFVKFSLTQYIGFCIGVLLILAGVYGLAPTDMKLFVPPLLDEFETDESMKLDDDHYVINHTHNNDRTNSNDDDNSDQGIDLEKNIHTITNTNNYDSELDVIIDPDLKKKPDPTPTKQPNKTMIALYTNNEEAPFTTKTATEITASIIGTATTTLAVIATNNDNTTSLPSDQTVVSSKKNRKVVSRPMLPPLIVISKSVHEIVPPLTNNSNISQVQNNNNNNSIDGFMNPSLQATTTSTDHIDITTNEHSNNNNSLLKDIHYSQNPHTSRDYATANITPSGTSRENDITDNV